MAKRIVIIALGILGLICLFVPVFNGTWVVPQGFVVGPLRIQYYGIVMALAAGAGFFVAERRSRGFGLSAELAERLVLWVLVAGFIGARLYHVLSSYGYYQEHMLEIFQVWHGGLSVYGAVLGGVAGLILSRVYIAVPLTFIPLLNWLTPSVVLGQIIGRLGNFFNYELYGYPTNLPWKMFVPPQFRTEQYQGEPFYHPLFLYEALLNVLVLLILVRLEKNPRTASVLFFAYLFLYNTVRFFLEYMRIDSVYIGHIRQNAAVSALLAAIGLFLTVKSLYSWQNTTNTSRSL